ncbi:sensor histidine kinase [Kiloniella antarctica]|uniref:histidine kinase n=1 Tax=Kiloniella antarctica TaxID=1550907 RepID=A0ABW5BD88_9PROT
MHWWKNPHSVRGPLIVTVGLILMVGFLITNILSYQISKNSLRKALINNELPLTSNNIYSEIQQDLLQPVFVASLMANDIFVKDWLLDGERDVEKIAQYLDEIRNKYGLFTSFLVSEKTRNYYHFKGLTQSVSETDENDQWFFRVRENKLPYELNVDHNEAQGNTTTIFINHKIFGYDDQFLAAIGVGLKLDTVAGIVERYEKSFGRNVYFVDENGKILVRSLGATITEESIVTAGGISKISADIMADKRGVYEYKRDGEVMLLNTRYIPELGWRVIVEQEEAQALSAIRNGLMTNTIIGVAVILVTLFVVFYALKAFHSRLEMMVLEAKMSQRQQEKQASELAELAEQGAILNKQLKYEVGVKNRFFSIISHDLKSPFTSLLGMTHLMAQMSANMNKDKLVEYAQDVNKTGNRVFDLLQNLLEWSRLQMMENTMEKEIVSLEKITQENLDILAPIALDKGVTLINTVGDLEVFCDRNMVLTVLRNLIANALKFSRSGGSVEIFAVPKGNMIEVMVSDTGIGMSAERMAKIFALDEKTSTDGTAGEQGTGLGLPLCYDLVARNGGEIWVESTLGKGSVFHFLLPAEYLEMSG